MEKGERERERENNKIIFNKYALYKISYQMDVSASIFLMPFVYVAVCLYVGTI